MNAGAPTRVAVDACAGLGLRRALLDDFERLDSGALDFIEVAPENWIGVGGRLGKRLRALSERFPVYLHGLSLNLGGPMPLDLELIAAVASFIEEHDCPLYSEHLSYCGDHGHLYDLMPIPFTDDAVRYVAARIREVQQRLQRRIAIENVSYYAAPAQQLSEAEFINAVLSEADCDLLLDVNNVFVNGVNHGYDAAQFVDAMPAARVRYLHVAGHYVEAPDLCIDTHGADVIDPVWQLLQHAVSRLGVLPTLLERDFNFPPMNALLDEVALIRRAQRGHAGAAPMLYTFAGGTRRAGGK